MQLVIIGAGGHGKVAADCAKACARYASIVFLDAKPGLKAVNQWPVVGIPNDFTAFNNAQTEFFVAIGHNATREQWQQKLEDAGVQMATLIHPSVSEGADVTIGAGTLVLAKAAINIDSQIGKGCIVNTGATIDHDCELGNYVHIAPGTNLAGDVKLGDRVFCGIGSAVIQCIRIAKDCTIGAGSTVIKDIPEGVTAVGTPARVL